MSTEELLKPRYKVIADYPGSKFITGQVLLLEDIGDGETEWISETGFGLFEYMPKNYPSIFKLIQWWEDRDKNDMPQYVRFPYGHRNIDKGEIVKVFNWYKYPDACIFHNHIHPKWMIPSTEIEYNEYLKQSKK